MMSEPITQAEDRRTVKILADGEGKFQLTTEDALSYQPDACRVIPMTIKEEQLLREELDAWDAASDEALEALEDDLKE